MNVDLQAARNYAEALLASAKDQNALSELMEQGGALRDALNAEPRAKAFLEAPHIPGPEKIAFAEKVLGDRYHPLLRNFILLLLRKGRITLFSEAISRFITLAEREQGRWQGTVRTAQPLDERQRELLKNALERATGRTLVLDFHIDPAVIGGVVFKSGDLLMDNSVATQLGNLRERLYAVRVH